MDKREIETKLLQSIHNITPNCLEDIKKEIFIQCNSKSNTDIKHNNVDEKEKIKVKKSKIIIVGVALFIVIVFSGFMIYYTPITQFSIDMNPSFIFSFNIFEKVISIDTVDDVSASVTQEMDFLNKDLYTSLDLFFDKLIQNNIISMNTYRNILLSVNEHNKFNHVEKIENRLTDITADIINRKQLDSSIIVQTVNLNEELQQISNDLRISPGKAQIIEKIAQQDPNGITKHDMALMSIDQIILYVRERNISLPVGDSLKGVFDQFTGISKIRSDNLPVS